MTRIVMKSLIAAFAVAAPAAAQDRMPSPWAPPAPPAPAKIRPFSETVSPKPWMPPVAGYPTVMPAAPASTWPDLERRLALRDERVMNIRAMPSERATVLSWAKAFPLLGNDFEVVGAGTADSTLCAKRAGTDRCIPGTYNCIAYTGSITNIWVNPYQNIDGWNMFYNPLGYKLAKTADTSEVAGVQKVAVYASFTIEGKLKEFTHAAIQDTDGTWTSKLGSGPLIRHRTADAVSGPSYGEVVLVYTKKRW